MYNGKRDPMDFFILKRPRLSAWIHQDWIRQDRLKQDKLQRWMTVGGVVLSFGTITLITATGAIAQPITDGSLGTSVISIPAGSTGCPSGCFEVKDGTANGNNLFHSFSQFDLPSNTRLFFNHDPSVQRIISRVTGGRQSLVDGLVETNPGVSLFLINPQGFVLGPNAQINVADTFVAASADSIHRSNSSFSTSLSEPLLLFNGQPDSVLFGNNPGPIQVQGSLFSQPLNPNPGYRLALLGSPVEISDRTLFIPEDQLVLGGFKQGGQAFLSDSLFSFSSSPPQDVAVVTLDNANLIAQDPVINGEVQIRSSALSLSRGSSIVTRANQQENKDGNIRLTLDAGTLDLSGYSQISAEAISGGSAGNIWVTGPVRSINLQLSSISTITEGEGGNITLEAEGGDITLALLSSITSRAIAPSPNPSPNPIVANINLTGENLAIWGGSKITTVNQSNHSSGNVGYVNLNFSDKVEILGYSQISTSVLKDVENAAAGDITIAGSDLELGPLIFGNGEIKTTTNVPGGDIQLNFSQKIRLQNSSLISATVADGTLGNASGNISFNTPELELRSGSSIETQSPGSGGNLALNLPSNGRLKLKNSSIQISTGSPEFQFLSLTPDQLAVQTADDGDISLWVPESVSAQLFSAVSNSAFAPIFKLVSQPVQGNFRSEISLSIIPPEQLALPNVDIPPPTPSATTTPPPPSTSPILLLPWLNPLFSNNAYLGGDSVRSPTSRSSTATSHGIAQIASGISPTNNSSTENSALPSVQLTLANPRRWQPLILRQCQSSQPVQEAGAATFRMSGRGGVPPGPGGLLSSGASLSLESLALADLGLSSQGSIAIANPNSAVFPQIVQSSSGLEAQSWRVNRRGEVQLLGDRAPRSDVWNSNCNPAS